MFKFLKDKLSKATSLFSKKVEEEAEVKNAPAEVLEESPAIEEKKELESPVVESITEYKQEEPAVDDASKQEQQVVNEIIKPGEIYQEETPMEEVPAPVIEEGKPEIVDSSFEESAKRLEEQKRIEEAMQQEEFERQKLEDKRRAEEEKLEQKQKELVEKQAADAKLEEERIKQAKETAAKNLEDSKKEKKGFFSKLFGKKNPEWESVKPSGVVLEKEDFENVKEDYSFKEEKFEIPTPTKTEVVAVKDEKLEKAIIRPDESESKGFFEKIKESVTTVKISDEKFNDLFWDLELGMLENNVAVEVIEKVKEDLKTDLTSGKVSRSSVEQIVQYSLRKSFEGLFTEAKGFDLIERIKSSQRKPFVVAFIGVNGSGKTTTMAKVANLLKKSGLSVVFAASDTFRAAAMQQLQEHADNLGIKMIRHDYESDPAAVAFDAIKHAEAKNIDVVLIDTAGRLHTNDNLMNELKKLIRVNKPDLKIFIGESITGNDCVEQAKLFDEAVGIDAIILAKADVDEKGGAAISVSYVTKKPILYLGTGQTYDDLTKFDSDMIIKNIGL